MDFNEPLPKLAGFVVYTTLLDYIDTFVHQYTSEKKGKEFPSLRVATDMILTLLSDLKNTDLSGLDGIEDPHEAIEEIGKRLEAFKEAANDDPIDSRELGLFVEENKPTKKARAVEKVVEEPLNPLKISSKSDRDWLRSSRISYK